MPGFIDVTGMRFGKIVADRRIGVDKGGNAIWQCTCDCGNVITNTYSNLKRYKGLGCNECKRKRLKNKCFIHGDTDTTLHTTWMHMIVRCEKSKSTDYTNYGARGIRVCAEWHDYLNFKKWATENEYADGLTIDRIDVNGNYEPSNCRWATKKEQANNKRNSVFYNINGVEHTLSEWCDIYGTDYELAKNRVKRGVRVYDALVIPKQKPFGFRKMDAQ